MVPEKHPIPALPLREALGKQPPRWTQKHAILNSPRALRKVQQQEGCQDIEGPSSVRKNDNQEPSPPINDMPIATLERVDNSDLDDNGSIDYEDI